LCLENLCLVLEFNVTLEGHSTKILKHALQVAMIVAVTHPPAIPEIAIQNDSDIVYIPIGTYYYSWTKCPAKKVFD
jgi:hypothetical protein